MWSKTVVILLSVTCLVIGDPQIVDTPKRKAVPIDKSGPRISIGGSGLGGGAPINLGSPLFDCYEDGEFEDDFQCDKYWKCINGRAFERLCDDGLVFDKFKAGLERGEPCESPFVVDCGNKTELQEPTFTSEYCPRRHGFFADPDPKICDVFYTCIKGAQVKTTCSPGLHFDEITGTCTWPASAARTGCGVEKSATLNGFSCPLESVSNDQGMKIPHPSYPNKEDCQKFYVCLNGKTPQDASCKLGEVFNEATMLCDYPEHVPECNGWYANDPRFADYYYDGPSAGAADPGKQDTIL